MADQAEDVLELEDEIEDQIDEPEDDAAEPEEDGDADPDDEGETFISFDGEEDEAAPASGGDSSVIRELRKANREQARQIAELKRATEPKPIELGPEPDIEDPEFNWDKDKWRAAWNEWHGRKSKIEAEQAEARKADEQRQAEFQKRLEAFQTEKASLGLADFDEIEAEVTSVLSNEVVAGILHTERPAALMAALHRSPATLEKLSQVNLFEAAMMLGKLEAKVQVRKEKTNKAQPDRGIQGRVAVGGDRNLNRLLEKARKTGDYSDYFAAKRAAQ